MKRRLFLGVVIFFSIFFFSKNNVFAVGPTIVEADITMSTTWTKAESPYILRPQFDGKTIFVNSNLTIEPGVVVKFNNKNTTFNILGSLSAIGTPEEKIMFTSLKDDVHGGDSNNDGTLTVPQRGDWYAIINNGQSAFDNVSVLYGSSSPGTAALFSFKNTFTVRNSTVQDALYAGIGLYNVTEAVIEHNIITGNAVGVYLYRFVSGKVLKIANNTIAGNTGFGARVDGLIFWQPQYPLDLRGNWWGDVSGPYYKRTIFSLPENLLGKGNKVGDGILFDSWLGSDPTVIPTGCVENCFSNVMFLPGLKASRLYKEGAFGTEDQLWIPNYFGDDVNNLALSNTGQSINTVYTNDVLDEVVLPVVGGNIYKAFLEKLADLKSGSTINDYQAFAYDWRINVEDIVKNGTLYPNNVIRSAITDLETLAESSKSEKVTLVAHSNGGLLAKAMMLELEQLGKVDIVDKIVFVGTPQMGTPLALLSLLYGYDESALLGTLVDRKDARALAENMPGAYGLLPSTEYFNRMNDPFITFTSLRTRYKDFADAYGEKINNPAEFGEFLSGEVDGRDKPAKSVVDFENVLGKNFLEKASATHARLDAWIPPEGVEVIQIAGWGLDTVSGIEYTEKEKARCYSTGSSPVPSCTGIGEYEPVYEPHFTVDGDEVVVAPSALMLSDASNVKKYWVDLWSYDDPLTIERKHKDLFEVAPIKQFLSSIITGMYPSTSLPENIKDYRPNPDGLNSEATRLRMSLYSPLDIHLYDDAGHHTGPKAITVEGEQHIVFEEGIPNSYYYQFGDRKNVGFGGGEHIRVQMDGTAVGSYTLKLEEIRVTDTGEAVTTHTTFENLPVTSDTTVTLSIPENGLADMGVLSADMNDDGTEDYTVAPVLGGTATLDTLPPEAVIGFDPATKKLAIRGTDNLTKNVMVATGENRTILSDEADNTTMIGFGKYNEAGKQIKFEMQSLAYGTMEVAFSSASLNYEWALEKNGD
ncbi:MAG: right-handed parallel beta-helix repeat-containing protein, partial [Candidatus Moranbacteria bacterium]|nr:right-handed parallel beta-helix repeat-containing protein [Candidatus Moranbacteria bacterium]